MIEIVIGLVCVGARARRRTAARDSNSELSVATRWADAKALVWSSALLVVLGCSPYRLPPPSPRVARLPDRILLAGLYSDETLSAVAGDLRSFAPAYELWSDGALKRRWIRLPLDVRIDTSDMDSWVFPIGTQLWKEFSQGGRRLETRLLTRVALDPDGWVGIAYVWNAEQTEAIARPDGVIDVLETAHDVPSARACMTCHGGRSHRILGFSAIQLSHAPASTDDLTLRRLTEENLLSDPPTSPIRVPGTPTESQALGYLHSNCGRPSDARFFKPPKDLDLWLRVASLSTPATTPNLQDGHRRLCAPGVAFSQSALSVRGWNQAFQARYASDRHEDPRCHRAAHARTMDRWTRATGTMSRFCCRP